MTNIKQISNLHTYFRKADLFRYTKQLMNDTLVKEQHIQKNVQQ